jgi:hypothetical protein
VKAVTSYPLCNPVYIYTPFRISAFFSFLELPASNTPVWRRREHHEHGQSGHGAACTGSLHQSRHQVSIHFLSLCKKQRADDCLLIIRHRNASHTSSSDSKPHSTVHLATDDQSAMKRRQTLHVYHDEDLVDFLFVDMKYICTYSAFERFFSSVSSPDEMSRRLFKVWQRTMIRREYSSKCAVNPVGEETFSVRYKLQRAGVQG